MKLNIKSRKGFTLIELLVVIGILAVLAAIAIPSVAGLIDRANVSADKTNSNEMTNAVERFASEYELYCQDIASGVINESTTDFDSAQGRVYNVTGVKTRAGIETLEVAQDAVVTDDQIAIYRDTKYPVNAKTMQKVVENYTKTSSSTFEPKQSDMHYWYSPDCGVVVFAEPDALSDKENKLNAQIQSGMDAKGNKLSASTQWIDLTLGVALSGGNSASSETVVGSATFSAQTGNNCDGSNDEDGLCFYDIHDCWVPIEPVTLTWDELKLTENGTRYGYDASKINDTSIGNFAFPHSSLTSITIPDGVTSIGYAAFNECYGLTSITIPDSVTSIGDYAFYWCDSITSITIPDSVISIGDRAFQDCASLTKIGRASCRERV